jgi:hypothetical protein
MWTYSQSTGRLSRDGVRCGIGYSGLGGDKDNPVDQTVIGQGPIPAGAWKIGTPHADAQLGPHVMSLTAEPGTDTFGRSAFFVHGDSLAHPGQASHGCLILSLPLREAISSSGDTCLTVVA